jgi:hypothetical protein
VRMDLFKMEIRDDPWKSYVRDERSQSSCAETRGCK